MLSVYSVWHHFCFSTVLACLLSSRLVVYWEKQLKVVQYVLNLNFLKQTYIARFVVSIFLLFPGDKYILKSIFMFIYIYLYIKNIYFKCICFIIQKSTNQYVTKKNQLENLYTLLSVSYSECNRIAVWSIHDWNCLFSLWWTASHYTWQHRTSSSV